MVPFWTSLTGRLIRVCQQHVLTCTFGVRQENPAADEVSTIQLLKAAATDGTASTLYRTQKVFLERTKGIYLVHVKRITIIRNNIFKIKNL